MLRGVIYLNRRSGTAANVDVEELRQRATTAGLSLEFVEKDFDIASDIRHRLSIGQRLFVAAGGDGTIHHVAQPLINTEGRLAILPVGTVNHLAKDLKLPLDWRSAFDVAITGTPREIDVAHVNGTFFLNVLMLGLYPDMVREREKLRGHYGKFRAYLRAGRLALKRFRHVSIAFETPHHMEAVKSQFFGVAVNQYDMDSIGFVAPKLAFDHGRLAVYWLPKTSRFHFLRIVARYLRGRMRPGDTLRFFSTTNLRITSAQKVLRVGMDGELIQLQTPVVITIVPRGLTVMTG
jgi:diacylglycerol kinase family enzyme